MSTAAQYAPTADDIAIFKRSREEAEASQQQRPARRVRPRPQHRSPAAVTVTATPSKWLPTDCNGALPDVDSVLRRVEGVAERIRGTRAWMAHLFLCGHSITSVHHAGDAHDGTWPPSAGAAGIVPHHSAEFQQSGSWNDVYQLDAADCSALGLSAADSTRAPKGVVGRLTRSGVAVYFEDALGEVTMAALAAKEGFGAELLRAAVVLSDEQPADGRPPFWRMFLAMPRADGDMCDLGSELAKEDLAQTDVVARGLFDACAKMSNLQLFGLDLKLMNVLYRDRGNEIFFIDFDEMYMFSLDVHPKAAMLINLLLLATHIRAYFKHGAVTWRLLSRLQEPVVELWRQAKADAFDGAELIKSLGMPLPAPSSKYKHLRPSKLQGDDKLQRLFPAIVYDYFFDPQDGHPPAPARWPHWQFPRQRFVGSEFVPLVPQMIRYAFFETQMPPPLASLLAYEVVQR